MVGKRLDALYERIQCSWSRPQDPVATSGSDQPGGNWLLHTHSRRMIVDVVLQTGQIPFTLRENAR